MYSCLVFSTRRIAVTRSPILAFNALCYFDFFQSKNISFLTQIVTLLISILAEENQFIPSSLLNVLVCILHAISNRFCEDSLTFLQSPLFSPYLLFIREIILLCHLLQSRCTPLHPLPPRHQGRCLHPLSAPSPHRLSPSPLLPTPRLSLLRQPRRLGRLLPLRRRHRLRQGLLLLRSFPHLPLTPSGLLAHPLHHRPVPASHRPLPPEGPRPARRRARRALRLLSPGCPLASSLSVADCRALLLKGIGVEALVDGLARTTDSVGTATAIVLILTSLLQGGCCHRLSHQTRHSTWLHRRCLFTPLCCLRPAPISLSSSPGPSTFSSATRAVRLLPSPHVQ